MVYDTVGRTDISLESNIHKNEYILLSHIKKEKNLVTGLAWDNFVNIETLSGANTTHHTYSICYQNTSPCSSESIMHSSSNSGNTNLQTLSKRKRSDRFTKVNKSGIAKVTEPYWKGRNQIYLIFNLWKQNFQKKIIIIQRQRHALANFI